MNSKFVLPKIYPITDRAISGLSNYEQIKLLIEGGSRFIQLRDKSANSLGLYEDARECLGIASENKSILIVNDRVDIALATKADGVHLGQDDLPPAEARSILGGDAIIGLSTHSLEHVNDALEQPIDYIAFGPIFATNSKTDHELPVGLQELERVRKAVGTVQLVAIGGIGIENIADVLSAGADSAAMISAVLSDAGRIAENTAKAIEIASKYD